MYRVLSMFLVLAASSKAVTVNALRDLTRRACTTGL